MKFIKRFLIAIVVLLVLGVAFLIAAPMIFKDQIVDNVKYSVNQALDAEVDFTDVDLSFLRSFPDISLRIENLEVMGIDTFAGLPLMTAKSAGLDIGFWSVVTGDASYKIDDIELDKPLINLLVLTPELANYLVVPEGDTAPTETSTAPATAQIQLQHFQVKDGTFVYDDRTTETLIRIEGLNTEGDGDFTSTVFDLKTMSTIEELSLEQSGVTYLNKVKTVADATVNIDLDQSLYTFLDNKVTLNALELVFGGNIDMEDNGDILFDIDYEAPVNDFRQLWSLIPSAYTAGYEEVKTKGSFTLAGTVDGPFNSEKEQYPAFTVNTKIIGGSVQYPGRSVGITGIDALIGVNSPSSDLNDLVVKISQFDFNLGGDPFKGRLELATLINDPQIDGFIDGKVDLGKWSQAIPLEGVRELAGILTAKLTMDGIRQSLIEAGNYNDLNLGGIINMTGFVYATDEMPTVKINNVQADFTPQAIQIADFTGNLGRSDVKASGTINNPLAYFSPKQTMRGNMNIRSDFFDADEWMPEETVGASASPAELNAAATPVEETAVFDRFDFDVDAEIGALNYAGYRPENIKAVGNIKPNELSLANAGATLGESDFAGSGNITNLFEYTFGEGVLGGNLFVRSNSLNMNDFMDEDVAVPAGAATEAPAESAVIPIPKNINLNVDMVANEIKYTDITLKNVVGALLVKDGQAVVENGSAGIFGGIVKFAGAYDTQEPGDPGFRFHYDLQSLDFSQAFSKLNSFASLAPVGKFLQGTFSTDMVMEGKLGADLYPKLSSINAKGIFQTAQAQLTNFKPAQKIGQALNINALKESTTVNNLMTVFQIEDGMVSIEPFSTNLLGIPMQISGKHGLDQDMDYRIQAAIPRELIQGNIVTGAALSALDQLAGQAGKLGLDISPGDTMNVAINLGGSIGSPAVKFNLLGTNGGGGDQSAGGAIVGAVTEQVTDRVDEEEEKLKEEVDSRVDAATEDAQARLDSLKGLATDKARLAQDSIRQVLADQAARLKKEAADKLKIRLDSVKLDSLKKLLPTEAQEAADKLKEELGKFNPFKKKKKDGGGE
jgi:hypothetical protein